MPQHVLGYLYHGRVKGSHPDIAVVFDWVFKIGYLFICGFSMTHMMAYSGCLAFHFKILF